MFCMGLSMQFCNLYRVTSPGSLAHFSATFPKGIETTVYLFGSFVLSRTIFFNAASQTSLKRHDDRTRRLSAKAPSWF